MVEELRTNARTDTAFILASITLNLIALAVNAIVAADDESAARVPVFFLFVALVLVINAVVILGLRRGRTMRESLLQGLVRMYDDHGVSGYYDPLILKSYDTRYILFTVVVVCTGVVAIAVPVVLLVM